MLEVFGDATPKALQEKVVDRRAKLLLLLYADDSTYFDDASAAFQRATNGDARVAALRRRQISRSTEDVANKRLAALPRYRHPLERVLE